MGNFPLKKKKKERFQLAQASHKGKQSPKGPPPLSLSHLVEPRHLSQEVPVGSFPLKGDLEKNLIQQRGSSAGRHEGIFHLANTSCSGLGGGGGRLRSVAG